MMFTFESNSTFSTKDPLYSDKITRVLFSQINPITIIGFNKDVMDYAVIRTGHWDNRFICHNNKSSGHLVLMWDLQIFCSFNIQCTSFMTIAFKIIFIPGMYKLTGMPCCCPNNRKFISEQIV